MSPSFQITALTNGSPHSWVVLNALAAKFGPIHVLVEDPQPRGELIRRRMKKQGAFTVAGQIGFVFLQKLVARLSAARIREIIGTESIDPKPNPSCRITRVGSVNSEACRKALAESAPRVVVVFGTRIIGRETLNAIKLPLINFHSGINPAYRGQAGGYWALANGDPSNAGVTVHLVDAGVDTGEVLYQAPFTATRRDNFTTYFWLQAAAIRPLAVRAVGDALQGRLKPFRPPLPSRQWYHPTLWFYLWTGLTRGVW
jgi:methionyl-tRNA formyltransferase